jgi:hypothetical protein
MNLTSGAAQDLKTFALERGGRMLTERDDVHQERWDQFKYEDLRRFRLRNQINELPGHLSRADIFLASRTEPPGVAVTFLWSMMWGYQSEGTGAYRTDVALGSPNRTPVETRLTNIFACARSGNLSDAFALMRGSGTRVRNVNTAFGTKFLYFAGYDDTREFAQQPLILDRRVVSALRKVLVDASEIPQSFADLTLCSYDDYAWYLDAAKRIRDVHVPDHGIDVVEFFLWCHA